MIVSLSYPLLLSLSYRSTVPRVKCFNFMDLSDKWILGKQSKIINIFSYDAVITAIRMVKLLPVHQL